MIARISLKRREADHSLTKCPSRVAIFSSVRFSDGAVTHIVPSPCIKIASLLISLKKRELTPVWLSSVTVRRKLGNGVRTFRIENGR